MRKKIAALSKRFLQTELVNGSLYIMLASSFGNFFAFLFNLFLTRQLSYEDYGIFTSLVAFTGLFTIFAQSFNTSLSQYATQYFSKNDISKAAHLYRLSLKYLAGVSIFFLLFFIIFSHVFGAFLHIHSFFYFVISGMSVALTYFSMANGAFLQSLLKFKLIAYITCASNIAKLLFGVVLIYLGWHVFGALGAVIVTSLTTIVIGFFPLRFLLTHKQKDITFSQKELFAYMGVVTLVTFALTSFTSSDIILVKHFFPAKQAGLYAGLSLIGKVIFYFSSPIATVLFPIIVNRYHQKVAFMKTFYSALLLVFLPSFAITLFYFLFPTFSINFFLGGKGYLVLQPYIWMYALFITSFSLLSITVTFLLSLKKTKIVFPITIGALLQIIGIIFFHQNFLEIILISLIITSILLVSILLYYVKHYESKKNAKDTATLSHNTSI